jgi:epoxyqueuosine reductase
MSYLERNREKRLDPRRILPGAKTVVSVAFNYLGPMDPPSNQRSMGVVSRYAVGTDYHIVLEKKLGQLLDDLRAVAPDIDGKIYVDTGPVLEKHWAVMAGLGWLGKHTNVISRKLGSWFSIGEILLDVELEADAVEDDFCGSCTRCIDACPTNAIVEPYVLDASKCLSYSTIELKEDVPEELREPAGNLN